MQAIERRLRELERSIFLLRSLTALEAATMRIGAVLVETIDVKGRAVAGSYHGPESTTFAKFSADGFRLFTDIASYVFYKEAQPGGETARFEGFVRFSGAGIRIDNGLTGTVLPSPTPAGTTGTLGVVYTTPVPSGSNPIATPAPPLGTGRVTCFIAAQGPAGATVGMDNFGVGGAVCSFNLYPFAQ